MTAAEARYQVTPNDENLIAAYPQLAVGMKQAEAMGGKMENTRLQFEMRDLTDQIRTEPDPARRKILTDRYDELHRQLSGGGGMPTVPAWQQPGASPAAKVAGAFSAFPELFKPFQVAVAAGNQNEARRLGAGVGLSQAEVDAYFGVQSGPAKTEAKSKDKSIAIDKATKQYNEDVKRSGGMGAFAGGSGA